MCLNDARREKLLKRRMQDAPEDDCDCVIYLLNPFGFPDFKHPIVDADCPNHDWRGKKLVKEDG